MLDQIRRDIQALLDEVLSEVDKLRRALAALTSRESQPVPANRPTPETSSAPAGESAPTSPHATTRRSTRTRKASPSTRPSKQKPASLTYERGDASAEDLRAAIEQFFSALDGDDRELLEDAEDHGVDLEALKRIGPQAITLREESRERMGAETAIVVGLVVHVAGNEWDDVVLPWIKRKLGSSALGKKLQDRS